VWRRSDHDAFTSVAEDPHMHLDRRRLRRAALLVIPLVLPVSARPAHVAGAAGILTDNMVVNPGADDGTCGTGGAVASIPGWQVRGDATVICWSAARGRPVAGDPGPGDRGTGFFSGGRSTTAAVVQIIDLAASAAAIDGGGATFSLGGWFGGYQQQDDHATLSADFLDGRDVAVATAIVPTVTASERSGATGLINRSTTGAVPSGARRVRLTVTFTRVAGVNNDGYADSVSFTLGNGAVGARAANLVANPGADSGSCTGGGVAAIPGWTSPDGAVAMCWLASEGLPPSTPGPADRGRALFAGGRAALSHLEQDIDLAANASSIDHGSTSFQLSAWIGGYTTQDDAVQLEIDFLDANELPIGVAVLDPVGASDRAGNTSLLLRSVSGPVAPGTRTARLRLTFTRTVGIANDGYVDSIVYRQIPQEPDDAAALTPAALMSGDAGSLPTTCRRDDDGRCG
jgi:hypothetical protein